MSVANSHSDKEISMPFLRSNDSVIQKISPKQLKSYLSKKNTAVNQAGLKLGSTESQDFNDHQIPVYYRKLAGTVYLAADYGDGAVIKQFSTNKQLFDLQKEIDLVRLTAEFYDLQEKIKKASPFSKDDTVETCLAPLLSDYLSQSKSAQNNAMQNQNLTREVLQKTQNFMTSHTDPKQLVDYLNYLENDLSPKMAGNSRGKAIVLGLVALAGLLIFASTLALAIMSSGLLTPISILFASMGVEMAMSATMASGIGLGLASGAMMVGGSVGFFKFLEKQPDPLPQQLEAIARKCAQAAPAA